jgi:hypothetical protein
VQRLTPGLTAAGRRVNAQVSMSRTKKSCSTAHLATSASARSGSECVPAAIAALSRVDVVPAPSASRRRVAVVFELTGTTSCTQ